MDSSRSELPLTVRLVEAVADARDETSESLEPLATYFNPDALQRFVESTAVPASITIEVYDCTVEINNDGAITVRQGNTADP